jgi:hypothetical protein
MAVQEARRKRTIHIVKLDWLKDSLLSKSGKPLDTSAYQWEQRQITTCNVVGSRKRRRDRQKGDPDDDQEGKNVPVAKKLKAQSPKGGELSKDVRVEKAGKWLLASAKQSW